MDSFVVLPRHDFSVSPANVSSSLYILLAIENHVTANNLKVHHFMYLFLSVGRITTWIHVPYHI